MNNIAKSQKKISHFLEVMVPLAKLVKHVNIQINETTKPTLHSRAIRRGTAPNWGSRRVM